MFNFDVMIQLFVLLNPLASFPFLISAFQQKMNLNSIVLKSTLTAFALAIVMALVGPMLFGVFGITLDSFRIAGGIVLLILGYNMIKPKEEVKKDIQTIDSLITIIATPMLTGPGVISFISIKSYEMSSQLGMQLGRITLITDIIGSFILVGIVFFVFSKLVSKVNPKLVNILSRVMGLFLMAIAVEMVSKGIIGIMVAMP